MRSKRITILKMVFYISWTSNNLICSDLPEAVTNLILNKQTAVLVLIHRAESCSSPLSGAEDEGLRRQPLLEFFSHSWQPQSQAVNPTAPQEPGMCYS